MVAVAVVAVAVVAAAGVAVVAAAGAAVVAAVAVAAVCPGEVAASAKSDRFPIGLTDHYWPGSTWSTRPIRVFVAVRAHTRSDAAAHDGRMGSQPCRKMQATELEQRSPVVGKHALQKRAEAASKL